MMKDINNYIQDKLVNINIQEKLVINSKTKLHHILDQKIDSLEELRDILCEYFDVDKVKISATNDHWKTNISGFGIMIDYHFTISLKNGKGKINKKVRCAMKDDCFLIQALVKDYRGKWRMFRIHGGSISNKFEVGTNLLDFLKRIKEATDNNDLLEHDSILMGIFNNLNDA